MPADKLHSLPLRSVPARTRLRQCTVPTPTTSSASTSNVLTEVVNSAGKVSTTTLLSSSLNPAASGQSITLTVTVTGIGSNTPVPTGTVTFSDGTTTLGTGTLNISGTATFSISTLSQGTHSLTAQYAGDTNYVGSLSAWPLLRPLQRQLSPRISRSLSTRRP